MSVEQTPHRRPHFLGSLALRLAITRGWAACTRGKRRANRSDILRLLLRLRKQHGDLLCFRTLRGRKYILSDPDLVYAVLHAADGTYVKGRQAGNLRPFFGNGLLVSDDEHSKRRHSLIQQSLIKSKINAFMPLMLEETDAMLARWSRGPEAAALNVSEEMTRLSTNIILRAVFGSTFTERLPQIAASLNRSLNFINRRWFRVVGLPLLIPTRAHRRFRHDREFLDNLIHSALTRGTTPSNDKTLIADMIHGLNAANGSGLTLTAARDEVITLCSAGQLTTANALVWSWYVLSTHPQWRDRLVEEIDSVVGGNEPTGESLERMALLDRIVCETLRLYPPIWIFTRRAMVDGLIGALPVPAGSELLISPYVIHRHPQHWPNPDDFDPDRFLPEAVARRNRHAYLPFGSGPRNCIGAQFALAEIKMVLVRVLQHFFLDLVPGGPVVPLAQMTLNVRGGLRMTHRRRRT